MTFDFKDTYIKNAFTLLGRNEFVSGIKPDLQINDYYLNEKCFELAEANYQIKTINGLLKKEKLKENKKDHIFLSQPWTVAKNDERQNSGHLCQGPREPLVTGFQRSRTNT